MVEGRNYLRNVKTFQTRNNRTTDEPSLFLASTNSPKDSRRIFENDNHSALCVSVILISTEHSTRGLLGSCKSYVINDSGMSILFFEKVWFPL